MPMAHCQTEGKNHSAPGSFDLYAGLYTTKLHSYGGVTDNLDRFQGSVKYNSEVSNYGAGKAGNGSFLKDDNSYRRAVPYAGNATDDSLKSRTDSNGNPNPSKPVEVSMTGASVKPTSDNKFKGMPAAQNASQQSLVGGFQQMSFSTNGHAGGLDKSSYGYSKGFYSKDATAEGVLALWGRPEVEIPKDDNSCFVGPLSTGDRSSHSSGELTSSDGHIGHGGKDIDSGSWSGRSSSGSVRGGSLKAGGSPSGDSPKAGSSSAGSSIGGSPTVARQSSNGNIFANGATSFTGHGTAGSPGLASGRGSSSSRGSSTEGSPTNPKNGVFGLPTSRSLNEVGSSGGSFAAPTFLGRAASDRSGERTATGVQATSTTPSRDSISYGNIHITNGGGLRSSGDGSPSLEIYTGGPPFSRSSPGDSLQGPRKSTGDLPAPIAPAARHVRQPSLGAGFYAAGTATANSPSSDGSPGGGAQKGGASVPRYTTSSHTSPTGNISHARSDGGLSQTLGANPPSRCSSDASSVGSVSRHSSEGSSHGHRHAGLSAASRSSSDVSSNGSSLSGGITSKYSPEVSSTGNIYSAGVPTPRAAKDVSANGNVYLRGTPPARGGSDASTTGNIYPAKISQARSGSGPEVSPTGNTPAGGFPASRHGGEVGPNGNIQSGNSAAKQQNGLSSNGFCVGGNFCGVPKTPNGAIHNGVGAGRMGSNSAILNGKSPNGTVLNSGFVTGGSFGTAKRESPQNGGVRPPADPVMITRGLSITDPEELKNLGNDFYKKGQFVEALQLYDKAIVLCPDRAPYRSNRAAALTGLGRLAEAEQECKEAIRLNPAYPRAHQRLGSIYLRLCRLEDSKLHFKYAGQPTERSDMLKIEEIDKHLTKSLEAKRALDWSTVIRETDLAVAAGADSAPQILALRAESFLKLNKLDEADAVLKDAQRLEASLGTSSYTPADTHILVVQAQIDMALGRFEDATKAAEDAAHFDPYNLEILALLKRARAVGRARTNGNDLFKVGKYAEASSAYAEGLRIDPANAVLLCNRAACRSKLGHWEKAVEDCNAALDAQPQYTKALLRRADCYAKLERWEDSCRDFEVLCKKWPADEDVARQMSEVQVALKKSRGEDTYKMKFGGQVVEILTSEQLRDAVASPGLAVVHFNKRRNERCRQLSMTLDQLSKTYPAVNFVKVDVDDHMSIAVSESITFVPTFKLYRNGLKVHEILGPSQQVLEQAVKNLQPPGI